MRRFSEEHQKLLDKITDQDRSILAEIANSDKVNYEDYIKMAKQVLATNDKKEINKFVRNYYKGLEEYNKNLNKKIGILSDDAKKLISILKTDTTKKLEELIPIKKYGK